MWAVGIVSLFFFFFYFSSAQVSHNLKPSIQLKFIIQLPTNNPCFVAQDRQEIDETHSLSVESVSYVSRRLVDA